MFDFLDTVRLDKHDGISESMSSGESLLKGLPHISLQAFWLIAGAICTYEIQQHETKSKTI